MLDDLIEEIEPQIPPDLSNEQQIKNMMADDLSLDGDVQSEVTNVNKVNSALFIIKGESARKS